MPVGRSFKDNLRCSLRFEEACPRRYGETSRWPLPLIGGSQADSHDSRAFSPTECCGRPALASWIEQIVETTGVLGIALLMFLENVFPPIPSELIMPLAGYAAARGETSLVLVILAGTAGSLAGALFWYILGRLVDHERFKQFADRHGRWLTMSRTDVSQADDWFDAHGHWAVLFGRLIPTVRTLISIPAGLSEMPRRPLPHLFGNRHGGVDNAARCFRLRLRQGVSRARALDRSAVLWRDRVDRRALSVALRDVQTTLIRHRLDRR